MTTQTEHTPFPSDETLAAYIDGRLDEATRTRVLEHIADCPECFEVVQVNQELTATTAAPDTATPAAGGQVVQWPRNLTMGLAAAAVLGAVVMLTPVHDYVWPHDDMRALAKVAPQKRYFEGRLTGFPHQEFYRPRGGADSDNGDHDSDSDTLLFESVAGQVLVRAMEHPNARTLHAEGVSYLELRDPKKAVEALEKARDATRKRNPQVLSDLAAAYIETQQYPEAVQAAADAWALAQTPEIAWNRALAAQRAEHYREAIKFWNEYLQFKDESPKWIEDAKTHLEDSKTAAQNLRP